MIVTPHQPGRSWLESLLPRKGPSLTQMIETNSAPSRSFILPVGIADEAKCSNDDTSLISSLSGNTSGADAPADASLISSLSSSTRGADASASYVDSSSAEDEEDAPPPAARPSRIPARRQRGARSRLSEFNRMVQDHRMTKSMTTPMKDAKEDREKISTRRQRRASDASTANYSDFCDNDLSRQIEAMVVEVETAYKNRSVKKSKHVIDQHSFTDVEHSMMKEVEQARGIGPTSKRFKKEWSSSPTKILSSSYTFGMQGYHCDAVPDIEPRKLFS